jgi:hypothetical protein
MLQRCAPHNRQQAFRPHPGYRIRSAHLSSHWRRCWRSARRRRRRFGSNSQLYISWAINRRRARARPRVSRRRFACCRDRSQGGDEDDCSRLEQLAWSRGDGAFRPLTFRRFGHAINTNEVFGTHSQTQIREPHHANLTLNVSDSQKRGSRVLRQRKRATITAIFDKRAAADALKGRGELLLAQANALRPSAADD